MSLIDARRRNARPRRLRFSQSLARRLHRPSHANVRSTTIAWAKRTADLKQGILRGAANCGYDGAGLGGVDGFLLMCAQRHPKHYLALLGKMLPPLNLNANVASASINEVRIISVPTDHFLSRADIERLQSGEALPIEQFKPIAPAEAARLKNRLQAQMISIACPSRN